MFDFKYFYTIHRQVSLERSFGRVICSQDSLFTARHACSCYSSNKTESTKAFFLLMRSNLKLIRALLSLNFLQTPLFQLLTLFPESGRALSNGTLV